MEQSLALESEPKVFSLLTIISMILFAIFYILVNILSLGVGGLLKGVGSAVEQIPKAVGAVGVIIFGAQAAEKFLRGFSL